MTSLSHFSPKHLTVAPRGRELYSLYGLGPNGKFEVTKYDAPKSDEVRAAFLNDPRFTEFVLCYGRHVIDIDVQGRPTKVVQHARYRGHYFRVLLSFWYSKKGNGHTMNAMVTRKLPSGDYVRVSRNIVDGDEDAINEHVAKLVRWNHTFKNANRQGKVEQTRGVTFARSSREPRAEEWAH